MAILYKWIVNSMLTAPSDDGLTDVVKSISWTRYASEEVQTSEGLKTYVAAFPGVTPCPAPDPANFTPYDELTEAQVDGWLFQLVEWQPLDAQLAQNIQDQINPPVVQLPLPWAPGPTGATGG